MPKFSSSHSMPIEVGGGKYIIEQAQKGDLFLTEKQTGEQIMIYESNLGEDIEIDEIRCPYFFDIFDDRLVIYRISAAENDAGFGIYNIETKENRQFLNGFAPIYLSGSMLYIENNNSNKTNNGLMRIDLTGDLDSHYDMLALNGIDLLSQVVERKLSPDGKYLIFLINPDYNSNLQHRILVVCDSIDGHIIDKFQIIANGCSPQYLRITDDNIVLILSGRHAFCDDYIFTLDLRMLNN